jgi:hypothetical protein
MSLTLELTPQEELRIEQARRNGFDIDALLRAVIAGLPPVQADTSTNGTADLIARWRAEAEAMTPDQIAEEREGWDEVMDNIRCNGISLHIPDVSGHE